ncbi:MAG: hypothetical protein L6R41_000850 [Letrouitia leprolyta]|nr:MAG: hypothetical protein L6R41_000850 [Letrouitia leprolyta]
MPGLNFTFGIENYFSFTFRLQLGIPSSEVQIVSHEKATSTTEEDLATPASPHLTYPVEKSAEEQLINPAEPPPEALSCQLTAVHGPTQYVNGSDDGPVFGDPAVTSVERPSFDSITPLPRTPKSKRKLRMAITPRRRFKTTLSTLNSSRRRTIHLPSKFFELPTEPLPIKPLNQQLPTPPESNTSEKLLSSSFQSLPLEIKHMIYRELLVSSAPIKKPHRLVCHKRNVMLDSIQPVKDIDSAILRVCRSVYDEALPVLYGHNTFEFAKPRKLQDFSHGYLEQKIPSNAYPRFKLQFGFRETDAGRFTLIRSIILRLGHDRKPYAYIRPPGVPPAVPDRKRIWSHWHQYFFNEEDSLNRYDSMLYPPVLNEFPALDKIELDFTEWQLGEADAIRAEPFVSKLGRSGGLSVVVIRGIKNTKNLEQLRQGLVKPGGFFTAIP